VKALRQPRQSADHKTACSVLPHGENENNPGQNPGKPDRFSLPEGEHENSPGRSPGKADPLQPLRPVGTERWPSFLFETAKTQQEDAASNWAINLVDVDRAELERFGALLDRQPESLGGRTVTMALAEQLLKIRHRSGKSLPLVANAAQALFERNRGPRNIVLKARQMGITTWAAARFFLRTITHPGTLTLEVAHTQESAEEIFRIVHRFLDRLPEELRQGPLKTSRANVRQIVFPEIDSQYRVVSAGDRNAGRGLTVQNLHCSELARWPGNPAEILGGLQAALAPGAELILESTPDGIGGCFYEEWQKAAETGTVRHFFPWWLERRYRAAAVPESALTDEERELMSRHGLDRKQIGYRRRIRSGFRGLAKQEYAEDDQSCFLSSGNSIFELDAIEQRLAQVPDPIEQRKNGELAIWLPPVRGKKYLVAVDPAGGGSEGDYSAAQVIEMETGMQCAEFAGHMANLELARLVTSLAAEYNNAWLVIERNNHGSGILALAAESCRYPRIYAQSSHAQAGYTQAGRQNSSQNNGAQIHGSQPGWLTTTVTRPAVLGLLAAALVEQPGIFLSRALLAECRSFVRLANCSSGARPGTHDDRVMAIAIALAARAELLASGRDQ